MKNATNVLQMDINDVVELKSTVALNSSVGQDETIGGACAWLYFKLAKALE